MGPLGVGTALLLLIAGTGAGVLGALLGVGGGIFLVPILVLALGVEMHNAVATSILCVIATSSAVAAVNVERGTANMRLGLTLELTSAIGAMAGGLATAAIPGSTLARLFAAVMVAVAVLMWRKNDGARAAAAEADAVVSRRRAGGDGGAVPGNGDLGALGAAYHDEAEGGEVRYRVRHVPLGLAFTFIAGALSGLLGIGGGPIKVPALHLLCGVPMKAAAATSNFMIGVTAVASATIYYGRGEVVPSLAALLVLGVLAGSALGNRLNRRVRGESLRRLFAAILVLTAIGMLWRQGAQP